MAGRFHSLSSPDVSAKDGSQETAVSFLGMIIGLFLTPFLESQFVIWTLFLIFTFLHLATNFLAVSALVFDTLNPRRSQILLNDYFEGVAKGSNHYRFQNPQEVAKLEPILDLFSLSNPSIELGVSLQALGPDVNELIKIFEKERYVLSYLPEKKKILIAIQKLNHRFFD